MAQNGNRKEEGLMMRMKREVSCGTLGARVYSSAKGSQWMSYKIPLTAS